MKKDIDNLLIRRDKTVKQAMKQLEENEKRIVFVIAEDSKLLGSIVDGDVRRWILAEGTLDETVEKVCNPNPYSIGEAYNASTLREMMISKRIGCVPVINQKREIVEVLFWEEVFKDRAIKKETSLIHSPIVIMAGGKGTRLDPFTKILPKPLIPIGDKTIIEIIIDGFLEHGVDQFFVSVNYKSAIIKSYFEELKPPYMIHYIEEREPLGTAGSLRYLSGKINSPMVVTNCDVIIKTDYSELLDFHEKNGFDVTLVASLRNYNLPYGICEIENGGSLKVIKEKPEYSFLVNTGMYVLNPGVLSLIPENQVFHITDLIERGKEKGKRIGVYPVSEEAWLDIGEWTEYKKALKKFDF